jgi:DNA-binding beta-propeller fold protein YncE
VEGRIDHLAADVAGKRIFVAALGSGSVEVVDLAAGKVSRSLKGFGEPQGILWLPDQGRLAVACGGDGTVRLLDGKTFEEKAKADLGDDADNLRLDPAPGRVIVGYGTGGLAWIDPGTGAVTGKVALGGHPESFQLERTGKRIFVGVPSRRHVAVVDREKMAVVATWPIEERDNFPMALDEAGGRLFIGCRRPPRLVVVDTGAGKEIARSACVGDADDVFLDPPTKLVFVIGGEGWVDAFEAGDPARAPTARTATAPGARTGLLVPELRRLIVAVPHRGDRPAGLTLSALEPAAGAW